MLIAAGVLTQRLTAARKFSFAIAINAIVLSRFAPNVTLLASFGLGGIMSISSANPRRIAIAAGCGALAIGLPYGAAAYATPESSAWALMALCVAGLGVAGFRRGRVNRLSTDIE
jgi:hypothetical protein